MAHKNILVTRKNKVSEDEVRVFRGNGVTFYTSDSEQIITISFQDGKNPFNWSTDEKTSAIGQPIVDTAATPGEYRYRAISQPYVPPGEGEVILATPKLIVDGGPIFPPPGALNKGETVR